ncbi:MAG TPA: DNA polymerase III subunit delta [Candidatus Acidoferrum sp.]|jgi:DNA polymerase-3 subunit delta|nr:DNA polymerase III subunit delta [Candidatus Acidoferrum sp.]
MARVSAQELLSRLEKGKAIPAILLLGDEPYLRDACRAQLIEKFVPEASRTWAVSRYSADRGETEAALSQAQSLPMLSPHQVVFLEDAEAIEKLGDKNREETVAQVELYLGDPAPFTVLVMEAARLDERMKLAKIIAQKTLVVDVGLGENPEQRQSAAVLMAGNFAKTLGLQFEKGAAEDLAERVAADLMRLKTEIEKLANYLGDRKKVTGDDVNAMVASEKTTNVWALADLLASRQGQKSMEFLDRLLRDGEAPLEMLGALTWMYRKLIEASEIRGAMNGWQAARTLGMRPEQAEVALRAARKTSKTQLLNGLRALEKADDRLKSSKNARMVLEFLVTELTSANALAVARN